MYLFSKIIDKFNGHLISMYFITLAAHEKKIYKEISTHN
jgi:hypothetical protein